MIPMDMDPMRMMPPMITQLLAWSDSESKVDVSDEDLPTPQRVLSKVQQEDDVDHVLDKGIWAAMPAKHHRL